MTLDDADLSRHVDDAKLTDYLLSEASEKSRSRFRFLTSFGFSADNPYVLRRALLDHWTSSVVTARPTSAYGEHCNVRGPLPSPDGRNPTVTTAWTKRLGETVWRFTTLLPK